MTAQPPPAIGHGRGALRDGPHRVGGVIVTSLQGGTRIDDHHQRGTVRDGGLPGGVMTSRRQRSHPLSEWQAVQRDWRRNYWKHQVQRNANTSYFKASLYLYLTSFSLILILNHKHATNVKLLKIFLMQFLFVTLYEKFAQHRRKLIRFSI